MRLIDADALEKKLQEQREIYINLNMLDAEHLLVHGFMHYVWEAPTIDAVPKQHLVNWACVIRCKECRHSQYDALFHMRWCNGEEVKDDDFCSYGERKDDE